MRNTSSTTSGPPSPRGEGIKNPSVDRESARYLNKLVNKFGKAIDKSQGGVDISLLGVEDKEKAEQGEVENIRFSKMNSESLESNVDNVLKMSDEEALKNKQEGNFVSIMKRTPGIILENVMEAQNHEVIMRFDAFYLATRKEGVLEGHYHDMGEFMKELPRKLSDPLAILKMDNGRINIFAEFTSEKNKNGIASVELNTVKDINSKNRKYNLVVSVFNAKDNYIKNNISNHGVLVEYRKEDLTQVNPQLYEWLATINDKSSDNSISENDEKINTFDEKIDDERKSVSKSVDNVRYSKSKSSNDDIVFEEAENGGIHVSIPNPALEEMQQRKAAEGNRKESFNNLIENDPDTQRYRVSEQIREESEEALLYQEKIEAYKKLGVLEDNIEMLKNMEALAKMDNILTVDPTKLEKTGKSPKELYAEFFESIGNEIRSNRFGKISLSNSSVHSEIRHGTTAEKLATIEAIPDVIEKGQVIFDREKQAGVRRFVVCAPIKIGEQDYYMGVMLQKDSQHQRLYLHNVVSMEIKREALASEKASQVTTGAQAKDDLSMTIILQNALKVKFSDKKITTEFDEENFDNEEIQRLADEERNESWEYYEKKHNNYIGRGKVREFILDAIDNSGILENLGEDVKCKKSKVALAFFC
ncbi:MAG: hypothetical protein IJ437_03045 [Clostridia bacterium]|nr:hypothetical protein [Clostridia bacterium]